MFRPCPVLLALCLVGCASPSYPLLDHVRAAIVDGACAREHSALLRSLPGRIRAVADAAAAPIGVERVASEELDHEWDQFPAGRADVSVVLSSGDEGVQFLVRHQLLNPRGQWIPPSERGALGRMMKMWAGHRREARSEVESIRAREIRAVVRAGRTHPLSNPGDDDLTRRVEDLLRAKLRLIPHHRGLRKALRDPNDWVRLGLMAQDAQQRYPRCVITADGHVIWPDQLPATQRAFAVQLMFRAAAIEGVLGHLQSLSVLTPEEADGFRDRLYQDIVEEFRR